MNMIIWLLILGIFVTVFTQVLIFLPVYLLGLLQNAVGYILLGVLVLFLAWCFGE